MMAKRPRVKVELSSGNVFEDIGLKDPDWLELKAQIAMRVVRLIEARGLTQAKAADILGLKQPHVSALMNGKISRFSIERLLICLARLGRNVTISDRRANRQTVGQIQFVPAAA